MRFYHDKYRITYMTFDLEDKMFFVSGIINTKKYNEVNFLQQLIKEFEQIQEDIQNSKIEFGKTLDNHTYMYPIELIKCKIQISPEIKTVFIHPGELWDKNNVQTIGYKLYANKPNSNKIKIIEQCKTLEKAKEQLISRMYRHIQKNELIPKLEKMILEYL